MVTTLLWCNQMRYIILVCVILAFIPKTHADLKHKIETAALNHDIDPALLMALVEQESSFDPNVGRFEPNLYRRWGSREKATSWGLTQVVLGWHGESCGVRTVKELLVPETNLDCGAKVLKRCIDKFGTIRKSLGCYNGDKTGKYASGVIKRYEKYAGINPSYTKALK